MFLGLGTVLGGRLDCGWALAVRYDFGVLDEEVEPLGTDDISGRILGSAAWASCSTMGMAARVRRPLALDRQLD